MAKDAVKPRSYVMVTENKLEMNYPLLMCFLFPQDCCIVDMIFSKYFDKMSLYWEPATSCTPFHFCCCIECSGEVAVTSPCEVCTSCPARFLFPCFQSYVPGLQNAAVFSNHMKAAVSDFRSKKGINTDGGMINQIAAGSIAGN